MNTRNSQRPVVTIIGLGYVGLPLAAAAARSGKYTVYGLIRSADKAGAINGRTYRPGIPGFSWKGVSLTATTDAVACLPRSDIVVVCVPTPVHRSGKPDLRPLTSALGHIRRHLRRGQLISIESTVGPGMCRGYCIPELERSGLRAGSDFDVSHCPERISPADRIWTMAAIPRIVASTSPAGLRRTQRFYRSVLRAPLFPVATLEIAEAAKMLENSFRDVNIALVNEFALACGRLGIDVRQVLAAAATKPFGFMPFHPGSGVGGDCIPVDPWYQITAAAAVGFRHPLLRTARRINSAMPERTVTALLTALKTKGITPARATVGILGLTYKPGTTGVAHSPGLAVARLLRDRTRVELFDPLRPDLSTVPSLPALMAAADALIVCTNHREIVRQLHSGAVPPGRVTMIVDGCFCFQPRDFRHGPIELITVGADVRQLT